MQLRTFMVDLQPLNHRSDPYNNKKMNFLYKYHVIVTLIITVILTSCVSREKLVYLQETDGKAKLDAEIVYTPVFQADDLLSIKVMGLEEEAVRPFNLLPDSRLANTAIDQRDLGYLVDSAGFIEFPVLGAIEVGGKNRMEVISILKAKLKDYIVNPMVHIRILNFKVTVLGEVKNPGSFIINNERITLFEALGLAGDMTINGVRQNVLVIREVGGEKVTTRVDVTSEEILNSSIYYLRQNDLVYVEPNQRRINSSSVSGAFAGIYISLSTLVVTTIALIIK